VKSSSIWLIEKISYVENYELTFGLMPSMFYFFIGTKVCEKLVNLMTSQQMKKDDPKLSGGKQTSDLEAYHSLVNQFAPKMIGFSYNGMESR